MSGFQEDRSGDFARTVVLPAALTLILLAALVSAVLHLSTSKSDALALARQERLLSLAVDQGIATVAKDQEASTFWDDAVLRTRDRPLDLDWIDNNLGIWFHSYYQHDEAYLLDPGNRSIYAMQDGRRVEPARFGRASVPALRLAQSLRARLAVSRLAPAGSAEKTAGASDLTLIDGRPALVSLKPIVSETGAVAQAPGSEHLHVAVRYLDRSFLDSLARSHLIDRARFSARSPGPGALPLRARDGAVIGFIIWQPFEPGEQVEDQMAPVLAIALIVVGGLLGLLIRRVRRSRLELEASRAEAQHLAFHDSLTGLPNRALFEDRLRVALRRRTATAAVLLLDLDRFKNVNDTMGHQAGDALIREFALRLSTLTRDCDTISRVGGDEFAILVEGAGVRQVEALAKRILKDIRRPFELCGSQVHVGVSIGIAMSEDSAGDVAEIVRQADIALYRAKDSGRDAYRLFTAAMDETVKLRATVEDELRSAMASGSDLCLHYQPQVAADGTIIGLEALLRWQHGARGMVTPDQFISIAEDSGLIVPLGEWVFRQACEASVRWPGMFIAVNLSPTQFRAPGFVDRLLEAARASDVAAGSIQLEVTESVLLDDDDSIRSVLARLRAAGFAIVLDDFGTGYSSLGYLRKFEVDKIKIDRSFIRHLVDAADSRAIVTALLALGDALDIVVAAEGVETAEQHRFLQIAGCREMQGHHFFPALPEPELERLLRDHRQMSA